MPKQAEITYTNVLNDMWASLAEGVKSGVHPFHTPVLGSALGHEPDLRTVVLRSADEKHRTISCHTDIRSPKVSMLQSNPRVAWLFYNRATRVQLRLYGEASIHSTDPIATARWKQCTQNSRQCYLTPNAPGMTLTGQNEEPSDADSGFENFAVISCEVTAIDWLFLSAGGHTRAHFDWDNDHWNGKWIAP